MVDRIEIASSTASGPTGPNDEKMAQVAEAMNKPPEPPLQVEAQPEPEPQLLAGKYKSPEELERAYVELQKKLGAPAEAAKAVVGESDFEQMQKEFRETGALASATYESLEKRGIPRAMVDQFIAGQKAIADRQVQEVLSTIGGEQEYQSLVEWASTNLDSEEIQTFNEEVQSGDLKRAKFAVKALAARRQVVDKAPRRVEGRSAPSSGESFRSMAELVAAMKDPRYSRDPAYRRDVEQKVARSGNLT